MLKEGNIVACDVVGTLRGKYNKQVYQVRLADGSSDQLFVTDPLRFYAGELPPARVFCRVSYSKGGKLRLVQDEYKSLTLLYSPSKVYTFKVLGTMPDSLSGKRRYLVSALPNYQHPYPVQPDEVLSVGQELRVRVSVRACPDNLACLHFKPVEDVKGELSPIALFERCGHQADYDDFFEGLWLDWERGRLKTDLFEEMQRKLNATNDLWAFDYLSVLYTWLFLKDGHTLEQTQRGCKLLNDINSYLLKECGMVMPVDLELDIERVQRLGEACDIVQAGGQDVFLYTMLSELGETQGLRDCDRRFRVLQYLNRLDKGFVERNLWGCCGLLAFVPRLEVDIDPLRALLSKLISLMNVRRKELNHCLLFDLDAVPERAKVTELIRLTSAILGVLEVHEKLNARAFGLNGRALFAELCRLLALLTSRERAIQLMNKATAYLINEATPAPLNRPEWLKVDEEPEALVELILSMPIVEPARPLVAATTMVLMRYQGDGLTLVRLPKGTPSGDLTDVVQVVYQVPGFGWQVGSLLGGEPWPQAGSLLGYRDLWKEQQEAVRVSPTLSRKEKGVLIRTKALNKAYKGLIFCRSVDRDFFEDGAICHQGYASCFWFDDLTQLFSEGLLLVADVVRQPDQRILFDITDNLKAFSRDRVQVGQVVSAHCLSYRKETAQPFFITQEGAMCRAVPTQDMFFQLWGGYEVEILDLGGDDYPTCRVIQPKAIRQQTLSALRNQLQALSAYNEANLEAKGLSGEACDHVFPYIHMHTHHYLRLARSGVERYNLLHLVRLVALRERSSLTNYYSALIQQMELRACREAGVPFVSSLSDFQLTEAILQQFPTLRGFEAELRLDDPFVLPPAGDSLFLRFFMGGQCLLGEGPQPGLPCAQLRLSRSQQEGYLVLCRADGSVGRMPLAEVWALPEGVCVEPEGATGAPVTRAMVLQAAEAVVTRLHRGVDFLIKLVPVDSLKEVLTLWEPGAPVVPLEAGDSLELYGLKGSFQTVRRLVVRDAGLPGLKDTLPATAGLVDEVLERLKWCEPQGLVADTTLLEWVDTGAYDYILYYLDEVRLSKEVRDRQGEQMRWLLEHCPDGDSFWRLAEVLLYRSYPFYSGILEQRMAELPIETLRPKGDGITRVIRLLLTHEVGLQGVVRMFYPIRALLGERDKELIRGARKEFRIPVPYLQLIELADLSVEELKGLLLDEVSLAARYALFEVVRRQYEIGAIGRDEVVAYINRWDNPSVTDGFSQDLFWVGVLHEPARNFPEEGVDRILRGGFEVFRSAAALERGAVRAFCQGNMQAYEGRTYQLRIDKVYRHYYLSRVGRLPVVIPKCWCSRLYGAGEMAQVRIVRGANKLRSLFAAEGELHKLPPTFSLLLPGDLIKVAFECQQNQYRPVIRSEFGRIRILLKELPEGIDLNQTYQAVVVAQKDEITFLAELV